MSKRRVIRGGSYDDGTWDLRPSDRDWLGPEDRSGDIGFRLVVVRRKP